MGFRETALTSDGERNALGMSHEWDVVIWGCKREQSLESVSAWVTMLKEVRKKAHFGEKIVRSTL